MNKKSPIERSKELVLQDTNHAKALADFLCYDALEELCKQYNIPEAVINKMLVKAVNRAGLYVKAAKDENTLSALLCQFHESVTHWDNPKETADTRKFKEVMNEFLKIATAKIKLNEIKKI